jgi:hypothetical protein
VLDVFGDVVELDVAATNRGSLGNEITASVW